jgi:hypothetical protein
VNKDLPLKALTEALEKYNHELMIPLEIVDKIYEIEKKYQFADEEERSKPLREIEKIIDEYIETL